MGYKEKLRPASFRGVPFEVTERGGSFGRRGVLHEYPQRDKSLREDLGRKAREITLTAFVIEPDYGSKRDALIEACERQGSGVLIHPTLGKMIVSVPEGGCQVSESSSEGGIARFTLTFIETGEITFPTDTTSTASAMAAKAADVNAAGSVSLASIWDVVDFADFVIDSATELIDDLAELVFVTAQEFLDAVVVEALEEAFAILADEAELLALALDPEALAEFWIDALANITGTNPLLLDVIVELWDVAYAIEVAGALTEAEDQLNSNTSAQYEFIVVILLGQVAEGIVAEEYESYDEATDAADAHAEKIIAAEAMIDNGNLYATLTDLRASMITAVEESSFDLPRVRNWTPPAVTSDLQLVQLWYGDGSRAGEPTERNAIAHPGFVQVEELKMLSK